ncbi:MAG TPA: hypothetical protein VFQ12_11620 [Thermoleophilaceae bacterium]|nr:hypothetical protein [Thermoleophilaceae bacterium]
MTRQLRRFLPSPAMIVALTALFVAMSGSAYALVITGKSIKNNSLRSVDVRNGTLKSRDHAKDSLGGNVIKESTLATVPGAGVAAGGSRQAVVTSNGALARGRNVTSVARTSAGRYQVIFDIDVRGCAYYATVGDTSASPLGGGSQITTASLASDVRGVAVRTWGPNGQATGDRPFHLIVFC